MTGRLGRIRVKNWQAHGDLTILAGYAPQENGPSEHKEHFWDQVTKTMAKLPRRTSIIFGGDFNGDPLPDDAAIGRYHPCESLTDNGAHVSEVCKAAQLWSPSTWAARPVPPNPCWEGNTWRGHRGEQSRPDHILLSIDLASPPVTVDFLSSRDLRGTALAPIDHAPLRITLRYRFRAVGRRGGGRRFDRARLAAATTDLHFAKQFIDEMQRWAQAHLNKLKQLAQDAHPDSSWQYTESSILELAMKAFQAGETPKRRPWLSENTMDLIIKSEEVVKTAAPWLQPAPLGALCLYVYEESSQLGHRRKHISACFLAWALLRSLRKLTNQIRRSCDQDKQVHIAELAKNMKNDYKTVWQRARDIAGTALGPRGRFFIPPDACQLTQADWDQYMSKTFEAQKVDTPKALLAPPGPPLTKIRLTDLRRALLRQRNFKAHPQDTLPPEIWKIVARFYPDFLKIMDQTTLAVIRKTRTAPTLWSLSPIWPVPKHNGKQGLQGKRPVNGVHCFSRAFMRLSYKRPTPSPYFFGGLLADEEKRLWERRLTFRHDA